MNYMMLLASLIINTEVEPTDSMRFFTDMLRLEAPHLLDSKDFLVVLDLLEAECSGVPTHTFLSFGTTDVQEVCGPATYQRLVHMLEMYYTGDWECTYKLTDTKVANYFDRLDNKIVNEQRMYNESIIDNFDSMEFVITTFIDVKSGDNPDVVYSSLAQGMGMRVISNFEDRDMLVYNCYSSVEQKMYIIRIVEEDGVYVGKIYRGILSN